MMIESVHGTLHLPSFPGFDFRESSALEGNSGFLKLPVNFGAELKSSFLAPIKATEGSKKSLHIYRKVDNYRHILRVGCNINDDLSLNDTNGFKGKEILQTTNVGNSTNILWHKCAIEKKERQQLLQQKGCVIWITGLSGSGKSTLACALSRALQAKGKLSYVLDGDNVRHGLNNDLGFKAEDRVENIRRIGEVAKLFADAGVICIASLISPYRKDRDACRALLPAGDFIEVFMDVPLKVCEARDPKGLYKLARAGQIKGFTGIDDPYEPPLKAEIVLNQKVGLCDPPADLADVVISYLEGNGYLKA